MRLALVLGFVTGCNLVFPLRDQGPDSGATTDVPIVDAPPPDISGPVRIVFVTAGKYTGNLGGLAGADQECQQAALAIPGVESTKFIAWLSTSGKPIIGRLTGFSGGYVLPADQGVVAFRSLDLVDAQATLAHAIDHTESGEPAEGGEACEAGHGVWTGSSHGGAGTTLDCNGWTSEAAVGGSGNLTATDTRWSQDSTCAAIACSEQQPLYCIEN